MGREVLNLFDLVGVPYVDGGMNPATGFDCWGCVRYALNTIFDYQLNEQPPNVSRWRDYVTIYKEPPFPKLQRYDIPMFAEIFPELVNHIGIMADESNMIHTSFQFGAAVCEPIIRYEHKIVAIGRPKT